MCGSKFTDFQLYLMIGFGTLLPTAIILGSIEILTGDLNPVYRIKLIGYVSAFVLSILAVKLRMLRKVAANLLPLT